MQRQSRGAQANHGAQGAENRLRVADADAASDRGAAGPLRVVVKRKAAKGVKTACFEVDLGNENEYLLKMSLK